MKKKKTFLLKITLIILTISAVLMLMIGAYWSYMNSELICGYFKYNDLYGAINSVDGCRVSTFREKTNECQIHSVAVHVIIKEPSYSACLDVLAAVDKLLSDTENKLNKNNSLIKIVFELEDKDGCGCDRNLLYYMEASNILDFDRNEEYHIVQTVYRKNNICSVSINTMHEPFKKMQDILLFERDPNILNIIAFDMFEPLTDFFPENYNEAFYSYLQNIRLVALLDVEKADKKRIADINFRLGEDKIFSLDSYHSENEKAFLLLVRLVNFSRDDLEVENVINVS